MEPCDNSPLWGRHRLRQIYFWQQQCSYLKSEVMPTWNFFWIISDLQCAVTDWNTEVAKCLSQSTCICCSMSFHRYIWIRTQSTFVRWESWRKPWPGAQLCRPSLSLLQHPALGNTPFLKSPLTFGARGRLSRTLTSHPTSSPRSTHKQLLLPDCFHPEDSP